MQKDLKINVVKLRGKNAVFFAKTRANQPTESKDAKSQRVNSTSFPILSSQISNFSILSSLTTFWPLPLPLSIITGKIPQSALFMFFIFHFDRWLFQSLFDGGWIVCDCVSTLFCFCIFFVSSVFFVVFFFSFSLPLSLWHLLIFFNLNFSFIWFCFRIEKNKNKNCDCDCLWYAYLSAFAIWIWIV